MGPKKAGSQVFHSKRVALEAAGSTSWQVVIGVPLTSQAIHFSKRETLAALALVAPVSVTAWCPLSNSKLESFGS